MSDYRTDTYCGLYCGACDIFQANENNTLSSLAENWNMKKEDLVCQGCKSSIVSVYCKTCDIRSCAQQKKVEFCNECEFYPCSFIESFQKDQNPHHSIILVNLKRIKEVGLENWLVEQKVRWQCPSCQERFSWYSETCNNCGDSLYNCIKEEKQLQEEELE